MKQYLDLVSHVMENGVLKEDRTGTGAKSVFGYQMRYTFMCQCKHTFIFIGVICITCKYVICSS